MILESLTLTDFRVFEGRHRLDLEPRIKYRKKRPIILFGGLNGAGKTTTLTAVRLALYGKRSLGPNISQKAYDDYLAKLIHHSNNSTVQANSAEIELTFRYASMGILKRYTVRRRWVKERRRVVEALDIKEDEQTLLELNAEQCQGFLNELVPIGVSDLFFFDGEKIAELAEDTKGNALGEAIKKLLGLDIIETLKADLSLLLRGEQKKLANDDVQKEISLLEEKLHELELSASDKISEYEQYNPAIEQLNADIANLEEQLSTKGGAWAKTREKEIGRNAALNQEKSSLVESLRTLISGSYPLSIAQDFVRKTLSDLTAEKEYTRRFQSNSLITEKLKTLDDRLKISLDKKSYTLANIAIQDELTSIELADSHIEIIHDISDTLCARIEATIEDALVNQSSQAKALSERLDVVCHLLDNSGKNIARAPDESAIKPLMETVSQSHQSRAQKLSLQKIALQEYKRLLREAMDVTRKLDDLAALSIKDDQLSRTYRYANSARTLIDDFIREMTARKIKDLEAEFIQSFHRLARKEDVDLTAKIDPKKFSVKLLGKNGKEIDKDELSAGEKQIYAISILEALARTSGRRLPIIIDTPLGRLDSIHRTKLINNYFPNASHQVIILSTDTEVDEAFYSDLSTSISHAYKLDYDQTSGSSNAIEGYFWKHQHKEAC